MNQPTQGPRQDGQKQIKIADNIPGGEYANAMQVLHNKDEFQIMFLNIMAGSGKVAAKVITSPGHFKRIANAMKENLGKYEEKFGTIEEASSPNEDMGFKG